MKEIFLSALNLDECARYLGYKGNTPDENILNIMKECEEQLVKTAVPRFLYKKFQISSNDDGVEVLGTNIVLTGNSIKRHLDRCNEVILLCATLSQDVDKLIRITELKDMTRALITDALASVAIEQLCDKVEEVLHDENPSLSMTYRFGVGYGDLSLKYEKDILNVLNAEKMIGLCSSDAYILTPKKSVICIIGLSDEEINRKVRSCSMCNMQNRCEYRKRGERCGF